MSTTIKTRLHPTAELPPLPTLRILFSGEQGVVLQAPHVLRAGVTAVGREVARHEGICLKEDLRLSRKHASFHCQPLPSRIEVVDEGSSNGTFVNGRRIPRALLADGDLIRIGDTFLLLRQQPARLSDVPIAALVGTAPPMQALRSAIQLVSRSDATVLLLGESGCGKDVVANAIHQLSARGGFDMTVFDCGAVAKDLIESELFGHEKGAFTGAVKTRQGLFETAHRSTLFLDELGELPLELQPKLLRALEQREIRRVGSTRPIRVDVRIIAATNRNLEAAVKSGTFRADLYARLAEITLRLPPLRDRREDILPLFQHAMADAPFRPAPSLVELLLRYSWPYNVREVFKVAAHLRTFGAGRSILDAELLAGRLDEAATEPPVPNAKPARKGAESEPPSPRSAAAPSREKLVELLGESGGNVSLLARNLGMSRRQVHRWLADHKINTRTLRRNAAPTSSRGG